MFKLPDEFCERYKLPKGWEAWLLEAIGTDAAPQVMLTGGVYPEVITKGKSKGRPNFKKPQPGTECKFTVSLVEYREIVAALKPAER